MRANVVLICAAIALLVTGNSFAQSNSPSNSVSQMNVADSGANPAAAVPDAKDAVPRAKIAGNMVVDSDGRPVWTSPDPQVQPTPPNPDPQDFQQNVKDVYFDLDRANLTTEDRATLEKDAEWLKSHPNVRFTIAGGADERGTIPYNLFLSDQRALVTRDVLVKLGVPENQILFATGWGKLYPVCTQSDESCWSQNRRSHLASWPPPAENPLSQAAENQGPRLPAKSVSIAEAAR